MLIRHTGANGTTAASLAVVMAIAIVSQRAQLRPLLGKQLLNDRALARFGFRCDQPP
jgi:hypothetical protein